MPGILGWQHSRAPYWSPSILPTKRWLERIRLLLSHRAFLNFGHSVAICVSALLWSKHIFFLVHHHPGCTQKAIVQINFCCPCGLQPFVLYAYRTQGLAAKTSLSQVGEPVDLIDCHSHGEPLSVVRILWPSRYRFCCSLVLNTKITTQAAQQASTTSDHDAPESQETVDLP